MRKRYILEKAKNGSEYWNNNWNDVNIEEAIRFCEDFPLRPVFDKYFPQEGKILEGGCGVGQFVIYYKKKGYDIEGIDFAGQAIERTLKLYKDAPIKRGNVLNLEYPDNYFKAYYSGGVVEHFEEGPFQALKEARRVLCNNGFLIITVPFFNLSRLITSYTEYGFRYLDVFLDFNDVPSKYLLTDKHEVKNGCFPGFTFYQYEYTKREFQNILNNSGFEIIFIRPFSIAWGMMDYAAVRKIFRKFIFSNKNNDEKKDSQTFLIKQKRNLMLKRIAKDILINENSNHWLLKSLTNIMGCVFGNMILFVCKAKKP